MIYPINSLAASRYRSRNSVSGSKSDSADAVMLANIVRTDAGAHRPLPDSPVRFSFVWRLVPGGRKFWILVGRGPPLRVHRGQFHDGFPIALQVVHGDPQLVNEAGQRRSVVFEYFFLGYASVRYPVQRKIEE
ncbi:hypothetical protein O4214_25750 [Rhodococcus erythropolis]|uniref:hypothetical protein n=1 Tax=Rhodococcus erythropolis TaxID=1833 RepID=UPI0022B5C36D|nr:MULTISPECIES: hypothetical protein [Rhodococcus erythropolis group]MCZ4527399.1 hypothetical protein [Rhodococcus erythropolis]